MNKVIVLNSDMTILGTTNYKRAIRLVITGKAETIAESDKRIHPNMFIPLVVRLIKAIRNLWRKEVPWSKSNISVRDGFICQYCGDEVIKAKATIDHVIPKSQGGKNSWTNTVCSCFSCNNKKEDRTPTQAKMSLLKQPFQPSIMEFLLKKVQSEGLEGVLKELGIY